MMTLTLTAPEIRFISVYGKNSSFHTADASG